VATPLLFGDVAALVEAMGRAEDAEAAPAAQAQAWRPAAPAGGGFFAGFNSLGAHASVNHFHAHTGWASALCHGDDAGWAPGEGLPCQRAPLVRLAAAGGLALYAAAWHMPGFLLAWEGSAAPPADHDAVGLGRAAGALCAWLAARGVPHNVVFARAPAAAHARPAPLLACAFTVAIFPRGPQRESFGGGMGVALAEIVGLAICTEPDTWAEMTGSAFAAELAAVGLSEGAFSALGEALVAEALPRIATASRPAFLATASPAELEARAAVWGELVFVVRFEVGRDISQRVRDTARGGAAEDAVGLPANDTVSPG
jgi:hypothetical protein